MKRRRFLESAAAGAALIWHRSANMNAASTPPQPRFTPCINQATTARADFPVAMDAYAIAGFRAVELWLDSVKAFLEKESVAAARRVMADHGIQPVCSCCEEDLFFPRLRDRETKWDRFKRKLELSAQLGARRFIMYSALFDNVTPDDYPAAVPRLREVGELARQFEIVVGIEFIRGAKFLGCLETTAKLLREAGHPNLGILLDTYHFYAGSSKMEDIEKLNGGEVCLVHINDVPAMPRELLEDKHRIYVGDGVIPLEKILRTLAKVYQGPLSFEAFQYQDQDPYSVARKGFEGLSRLLARVQSKQ